MERVGWKRALANTVANTLASTEATTTPINFPVLEVTRRLKAKTRLFETLPTIGSLTNKPKSVFFTCTEKYGRSAYDTSRIGKLFEAATPCPSASMNMIQKLASDTRPTPINACLMASGDTVESLLSVCIVSAVLESERSIS